MSMHAAPFLLTASRIAGVFLFAPVLGSAGIPYSIRAILCVMLAVAIYPALPPALQGPVHADIPTVGILVAGELFIGMTIGLLAAIPVLSVQLAGVILGQQMAFSLVESFNPVTDSSADVVGQFMLYMAIGVFVLIGGLEGMYLAVARTFDAVPFGVLAPSATPLDLLVGLVSSGFELAMRVSAPVLGVLILEMIAMGLLMKTMPSLNILSVGFAVKILMGFGAVLMAIPAVGDIVMEFIGISMQEILKWTATAGSA